MRGSSGADLLPWRGDVDGDRGAIIAKKAAGWPPDSVASPPLLRY